MKILMGSFQVCDALSILFELEKPPVEHFEGFIFLLREGNELQNFIRTFDRKFQLKIQKNSPIGSAKIATSMVGRMFVVVTISC
jgi:hypothetical protein